MNRNYYWAFGHLAIMEPPTCITCAGVVIEQLR